MNDYNEYYEPHTDFDYESLYERMDGPEDEVDYLKESIVLNELLNYLAPPRFKRQSITLRVYVMLYYLRPHFFNGNSNITQREIADLLGVSKQIFNSHVNAFRKRFGFYINGMRHEDARKKFADICASRSEELAEARRQSNKKRKG